MTLVERVAKSLDALAPAGAHCLVAVSGGPDSLALLDLLRFGYALHQRRLTVAHVDHGIHPESARVAERVALAVSAGPAGAPDVDMVQRTLSLPPDCSETAARRARRWALRAMAVEVGAKFVVLGHHADDQVETVLLRLLRGSGPAGLAGMAPRRGIWLRPLLQVPRSQLLAHLESLDIDFWSDPANADPRHLRSWLRTAILPAMHQRLPDLTERVLTAQHHASKARRGWDDLLAAMPDLSLQQEKRGISVAAVPLKGYSLALRHALFGTVGRRFGVLLGSRRFGALDRLLYQADGGGGTVHLSERLEAELAFGRLEFRRRVGSLSASPVPLRDGLQQADWSFSVVDGLAGLVGRSGKDTWLDSGFYQVRTWLPGDRMRPLGGSGSRAVGVLLKEARVAPGRRSEWPVITDASGKIILWVPGVCRSAEMIPQEGVVAVHVECRTSGEASALCA